MTRSPREVAFWAIGILLVLLYALIPVVWMISLSLKPAEELSTERGFFYGIFHPDFANYDSIFSGDVFTKPLINSIGIAAISTFIAILLAAMAAYALSRLDFPGKTLILSGALAVRPSSRTLTRRGRSGCVSAVRAGSAQALGPSFSFLPGSAQATLSRRL